jgi:hypothetical protein
LSVAGQGRQVRDSASKGAERFTLIGLVGTVEAVEKSYDDTHCFAGTFVVVFKSKELTTLSYELQGITRRPE